MRDFILTQAQTRDATFAFPRLRRMIGNWLRRRQLRSLESLEDHMLMDIGLSRADLIHAQKLPLDIDPVWELARQSRFKLSPKGVRHR